MNKREFDLIESYMKECASESAHDTEHIYRVLGVALDIAEYESTVDYDILIAASLLHDIGRKEQIDDPRLCHAKVGSDKAYNFLLTLGWSEEAAGRVRDCVYTHRFRSDNPPESLEAKILFDADKIDVCGAMGIARSLVYRGTVSEPLYTLNQDGSINDGSDTVTPSFFREYHFKLKKLYTRFYTDRGAQIAKERRSAAECFYNSLLKESQESKNGCAKILDKIGK